MPHATLLERHLLFVTGKGGTGKSTITAALALRAARAGKRVLVCEVNAARERIGPLLGAPPGGAALRQVGEGIHAVNVLPREAMREYGLMVLRFRAVYHAVFENRLVRTFLRVVPSLAELVVLGKILHEARAAGPEGRGGGDRWDQVLVDAPSTGHALQLLRLPSALLDTVPGGPLRHDAEWMARLLGDPERTAVALVTLPEEMPVNEAIELDLAVRDELRMARARLFVNAMPESPFTADEARALSRAAQAPPPLGPAVRAAELGSLRAEEGRRHLARALSAIDLPTTTIPLLPSAEWGRRQVEEVAQAIAAGGEGGR